MSAVIKPPLVPRVRGEEGETIRNALQLKNARNVGDWWAKFAGGVHCKDLRNDELRIRGQVIAVRMQSAKVAVATMKVLREIDKVYADLSRSANVVMFRRQAH